MASVAERRNAVRGFKRAVILEAAKRVFAERGLDGATMRLIASEAGYTPGALYYHYPDKEHVYADILSDSLADLGKAVKRAAAGAAPGERLDAAARAFFDYYLEHPRELDLSFYVHQGLRPTGLTAELNRQLNGRLIAVLQVIADAIAAGSDLDEEAANGETVALVSHLCGVLLMERSGRLRVVGFAAGALVERYLDQVKARLR